MSGWSIPLDKFFKSAEVKLDQVARKIVFTAYRRVIMRTPVDTGRARGNWQCSIDSPVSGVTDTLDPSGSRAASGVSQMIAEWSPLRGTRAVMTNNLPYIDALNKGHSKQAPARFIEGVIAEVGGIAEDAARGAI